MNEGNKNLYDDSFLVNPDSASIFDSWMDQEQASYYFNEIRRRAVFILQNDGEDCKLLIRRIQGTICPYFKDSQAEGQCPSPLGKTKSDINKCYNTGYVGGYYDAIDLKVRFVATGMKQLVQEAGRRIEYQPRSWTMWTPKLKDHDFIVTKRNERFEIGGVNEITRWRGLAVRQEFDTYLRPMTDPIYEIDVPFTPA